MNVTCSASNVCSTILSSSCVYYTGADLIYTGILTNDTITDALEKINNKFQDAGLGYVFQNGITQAVPGDPVKLGGVLIEDTIITNGGYDLTITENLIVGSIAITGGLSTQFLKADGSLDGSTYQLAGNYITALTGDGTASGPGSAAFTLATVNYSPGVFGSATTVPVVTVNSKGLVTNVTTTAINLPPILASFSGDVTGLGNINTPITLTLNTVNSNVYGSNTFLRFAVNGKGLITSATPVIAGDIYGAMGYVPVPNTRTLTINGVTKDLTANRSWTIDSLPVQTGSNGKWLTTDGTSAFWYDLYGNISQFSNDIGYLDFIPTFDQILATGNVTGYGISVADVTSIGQIYTNSVITAGFYQFADGSTIGNVISTPRNWAFPDADGILPLTVNGIAADGTGDITIPIGGGSVTEVIGTGSVNGITLSGSITSSGELLLSGYITLDPIQVTDALGYTPYDASNPNLFATVYDLIPYITTADANGAFYPKDNPNGFITINSIYSLSDEIVYNNGAIYINGNYYVPNYTDVSNWNNAYTGRIVAVTNDGSSGSAFYNYSTNILNIPEYTLTGLGGISATFLSAVGPELFYNYGTGVIEHNVSDGFLHVPATGTSSNGKFLMAGASPGVFSWETVDLSLQSILDTNHSLINNLNFQGTNAGTGNTGITNINGFGEDATRSNSGFNINAFGQDAARSNSGDSINALGYQAGFNNTRSYVNLFGLGASATTNNQTVLAGETYQARLSYNFLTGNVTHILPNISGTYVMSVNGQVANNSGAVTVPAVTSVTGTGTVSGLTLTGSVTSTGNLTLGGTLTLTSGDVTSALGFTPYNATNPNSYISRTGISSSALGLTYTSGTGVFSLTSGYGIPTTASQTNWDSAYNSRITSLTTTGSGAATLVSNVLNIPTPTLAGLGGISLTSLSSTATGLTYTNTTGVFSLTSGYVIPTTTSTGNWDSAYTNRIISLTTTGSSGSATLISNTLNIPTYTLAGLGGIGLTALSSSATGLTYNNTTGVFSLTSGYFIPTTASYNNTNWDTAYTNRITALNTSANSGPASIASNILSIPNYTLAGLGGVPTTRTITINSTSYDLSANRTWNVGTVTNVSVASVPSAFSASFANPTTTPALTITATGTAAQYIRGDGSLAILPTAGSGGSGANVSYFLNGSVTQPSQPGFGGNTYYQISKDPIIAVGGDFTLTNTTGYIARFITDANDPSLLSIPGGNWEFDFYMASSNNTGAPTFYVELYKYSSGGTFTSVGSTSATPTPINNGTTPTIYTVTLSVVTTNLAIDDRLAIRIFVNTDGNRTITLYTQETTLSQIVTTFAKGITSLNGLTPAVQDFATGTSGSNFNISSSGTTHTFNLPVASATNTGKLSNTDWSTFNSKQAAYTNLTTFGALANASGWLKNDGAGVLSYSTPTYTEVGAQQSSANLSSLSGLSYTAVGFVKMTGVNTFALDTTVYYPNSNPSGFTSNTGTVTSITASSTPVSGLSLSGGTITGSGTIAITGTLAVTPSNFSVQVKNTVLAGPTTGANAVPTFRALVSDDIPNNAANTTGSAAKWTTARNLAGNSVDGSANVNFTNKFIIQTTDAGLPNAQSLGDLTTGLLKNTVTTGTGVLSTAVAGSDYLVPNANITAGTNLKISYDAKGLVTGGTTASASDLTNGTTGSGAIVLANTPTLITPNIGVATGTSLTLSGQFTSNVATGTAPFVVASTTEVANLRAATASSAINVSGGVAGAVLYQTGSGSTGFSTAVATAGLPLLSGTAGVGQPTYNILGIAGGGTGSNTRQGALNTLANSVTSGNFLKGDGTNVVMGPITTSDIPAGTYSINISGTSTGITGTQNANTFYAGPTSGGAATPTFRQLVASDITFTLNQNTTGTAGSVSGTNVITNSNLRQSIARSVVGNSGNTTANVADIQSSAVDQVLISTATSIGWGTINTNSITNKAVTIGKIQDINTNVILGRTTASSGDIEQLTPATVTGMLTPFAGTSKGLVPSGSGNSASVYLNGAGGWTSISVGYTVYKPTINTTYTETSGEIIILVDNGAGNRTITIPSAVSNTAKVTVKKIGISTTNDLIIATTAGTIDDNLSINLKSALQYTSVTMISDGANWFII